MRLAAFSGLESCGKSRLGLISGYWIDACSVPWQCAELSCHQHVCDRCMKIQTEQETNKAGLKF
jgi:hypothetical protein